MRSNAKTLRNLPLQTLAGLILAASLNSTSLVAQSAHPKESAPVQAQTANEPAVATSDATSQKTDRAAAYYHYALAHSYEEMATTYGRPEYSTRAIEEYKLALNADPESKFLNSGLAELYFKTGRVKDAILAAQDVLKTDPKNLDSHKLLGRIYLRSLGNVQSGGPSAQVLQLAIDEYIKIVGLEPDNTEDRLLLGQLYSINHDSAKAEEQFKVAQKLDPDSEEVVLNLGRLYSEQGDTRRAIDILSSLPEGDQTAKTEFALGAIYDQLKDSPKAIDSYQKSLDLEPENLDTERALGQALFNDSQLDRALTAYKDIAAGDPNDAQSYIRIAEIQRRQGKYEDSLATLKKAKTLVSDSLEVSFNQALVEDSLGHYDEAAQILEKLVTQATKPANDYKDGEKNNLSLFLDRLANVYREEGKIDETIATYDKLIALGGEFAVRGYQSEVDAYRDAHQYDKATVVARAAVAKMPDDRSFKLMLAGQLADIGKAEEGIAIARSLLKNTAADRDVDLALAQIYTRLRKWKEAGEEIDKGEALSTKPDDKIYVYFLRGAMEERQKHFDDAESQFRKILEADPNNSMTLNYLGYMLADRGTKLSDALEMIQKAVKLDPQNYAYLDSLGWAYFKLGQYPQSEENLRKASERNSSDPTVHDHLGELYEKTGRLKLAAAQWEESLNEYGRTIAADADPGDVNRVQKKLDSARVRLAKETSTSAGVNSAKP